MKSSEAIKQFRRAGFIYDVSIIYDEKAKVVTGRITCLKADHVVVDSKINEHEESYTAITFGLIDKIIIHKNK